MKLCRYGCLLVLTSILSGCFHTSMPAEFHPASDYGSVNIYNEVSDHIYSARSLNQIMPATGASDSGVAVAGERTHCRLKDRFDRKSLIAYHFSDQKSQLGLKVDVDGLSWSDAGRFDVQEIRVNYRYRFQPIKKPKEYCLYHSAWQGLVGSGYNEFFVRGDDTVYQQIDDELDEIEDKIDKLF